MEGEGMKVRDGGEGNGGEGNGGEGNGGLGQKVRRKWRKGQVHDARKWGKGGRGWGGGGRKVCTKNKQMFRSLE